MGSWIGLFTYTYRSLMLRHSVCLRTELPSLGSVLSLYDTDHALNVVVLGGEDWPN